MPNWCECDLTVEGPRQRVEEFLAFVKGENDPFDFNKLIPYPKQYAAADRVAGEWDSLPPEEKRLRPRPTDGYNQGGYEWCVENWGTKWGACNVTLGDPWYWENTATVEINFDTAWSPPLPVVRRVAELFPDLDFDLRYFECGCGFHGMFRCQSGEVTADESGNYYGNRGG